MQIKLSYVVVAVVAYIAHDIIDITLPNLNYENNQSEGVPLF